jgi:electron transfer flavoprotein beta subunit
MLVVVCIKQVPDTTQVQIDPVTNTLVREGIPFIVNPYDTHALEEGLRLKDRFGCTVAAISMGPPNAEATLKKALALGVDHAILLSDRVFGGADTLATGNVPGNKIRVSRKLEGRHEIVEAPLPAMLTVVRELNRPRYPKVPMRLAAVEATVQVWNNQVLQLDEQKIGLKGSPTWVSKIFSPERAKGEILGDGYTDPDGTAKLLIEKLLAKDMLPI